jgi:uncharacterized 2Fe-2S/4Fe-4S cluster protein (DUF4445 family)
MPRVTFHPSGAQLEVPEETSLLEAACGAGETDVVCCGITPACGRCRAIIHDGEDHLTTPDPLEAAGRGRLHFLPGERFGCMARVLDDVQVEMTR